MFIKGPAFKLILGGLFTLGLSAAVVMIYMAYYKPYAPTLLAITASDAASTDTCNPIIHFRDNSQNEDGFRLYRFPPLYDFALIKTLPAQPGKGLELLYTDQDVLQTGTYFYKISAYNKFGESYSAIQSVSMKNGCAVASSVGPSAPPIPPIITSLSILNQCKVRISFNDNSTNEQGFKIVRSTLNSGLTIIATLGPHAGIPATYDDTTKLSPGKYTYFINVYNQNGNADSNAPTIEVTSDCNPTSKHALPTTAALVLPTMQKLSANSCTWQSKANVFLRKGPNVGIYDRLVSVEAGKGFPIVGQSEDGQFWAVEVSPGVNGYITKSENYSLTSGDCSNVPTLKDPPPPVIKAVPTKKTGGSDNPPPATPCPVGAVCP